MPIKEIEIDSKMQAGAQAIDKLVLNKSKQALRLYKQSLGNIQKQIAGLFATMGSNPSLNEANKYNRLNNLERAIKIEIQKLTQQTANITGSAIKESFRESYNVTGYAVESSLLVKGGFGFSLPTAAVNAHLFNDLGLIKWTEALRANQAIYLKDIKNAIGQGLIQGEGYGTIARNVKSRADIGASKLIRIINTETHRAQSEGTLEGYDRLISRSKEIGIQPTKKWLSTLDDKTRSTHQSLDQNLAEEIDGEQLFTSNGYTAPGPGLFGVASEDINCRCTTTLSIEGVDEGKYRRARENGKSVLTENMSYTEWAKARNIKTNPIIKPKISKKILDNPRFSKVEF
jgi:hypothetical protein